MRRAVAVMLAVSLCACARHERKVAHADQLSDGEVRAVAYRVETLGGGRTLMLAQWVMVLGIDPRRVSDHQAGNDGKEYWERVALNDRYRLWVWGVGKKPRDAFSVVAVSDSWRDRLDRVPPEYRALRSRSVKVDETREAKRTAFTQLGKLTFRLPGVVDRVKEQYRWTDEQRGNPYGYGEYRFTSTAYGALVLQVLVIPGSKRGLQTGAEQMASEVAARGQAASLSQEGTQVLPSVKAMGRKVPLLEIADRYRKGAQAAVPVDGGTVNFYLAERSGRGVHLEQPLREIVRSVRMRSMEEALVN